MIIFFVISGKFEIDRLKEEFDINIPEGEYETIAGFIITELGMIPNKRKIIKLEILISKLSTHQNSELSL